MSIFNRSANWVKVSLGLFSLALFSIPLMPQDTLKALAGDTIITTTRSFAMRCRDTQIPNPYARGFIEWTSAYRGSPPYPVPSITMIIDLDRWNVSEQRFQELANNASTLTAFNGKFQVPAISPYNAAGRYKGYQTFYSNSIALDNGLAPRSDELYC